MNKPLTKQWSYKQVTENAEQRIKEFMQKAADSNDQFHELMYTNWAFGVFTSWSSLTCGWMESGDRHRLESLTEIEKYTKTVKANL